MTNNLNTQNLKEYLEEGANQAQRLMQLLNDERSIISSNDGNALENIAASKEKLAKEIQASTQICNQRLEQAGYNADNRGLIECIQSCTETHSRHLKETWEKLQSLLKECQDANRINGKLLGNSQRRIKQALSILQGKPLDEELYGRGGETVHQSTGNTLTHA